MMLVVSYDVNTTDSDGAKRLRKVAKICESYGVRVQNSVFELILEPAQVVLLKAQLSACIHAEADSVRFYCLGSNWKPKVDFIGKPLRFAQDDVVIL